MKLQKIKKVGNMNCKKRLEEYIENDMIYQDYKENKLMNPSDFDKFCIQHCKDIEELLEENQELKKQLKEWKHHLKCSKEMLDIQGQKGNYDYDEYMLGLYNGMEYIIALFETREPNFISGKNVEFTKNKSRKKAVKQGQAIEISKKGEINDRFKTRRLFRINERYT